MRLADMKAIAAEYDCTVTTSPLVDRGEMIVINPAWYRDHVDPTKRILVINPEDSHNATTIETKEADGE